MGNVKKKYKPKKSNIKKLEIYLAERELKLKEKKNERANTSC